MSPDRRLLIALGLGLAAQLVMGAGQQGFLPPKPIPKPANAPAASLLEARPASEVRAGFNFTGVSGWLVVDMETGQVVDHHNADRPFIPASVAKLPTAAFALDALGPSYRFETRVLAAGEIRNGRLNGDLVLEGGGNPELDTDALAPLASQVAKRGVRQVTGRLVADGSALPQLPQIEESQGDASTYNPSVSGLNLNYNRVHVKWDARGGRNSLSVEAAAERLSPEVQGVRVAVANRRGGPVFSFSDQNGREEWQMAARAFRGRAARWLPVKRPEAYAAEVFALLAAEHGIELGEPTLGTAPGDAQVLASHRSRPLGRILRDMLRYSTNLTAEVTGTAATRSVGVAVESLGDSAAVMNAWAASVAGFPVGDPGFRFANHSGLTTASQVSPRRMVDLLMAFARREAPRDAAHPRIPGAIAGYLKRHNVVAEDVPLDYDRLSVVAKTGTMSYIRGLAGYVATPKGRKLAFAVFSNNLAARGGSGGQPVNRSWMAQAKGFERAMIRNWVMQVDG